MVNPLTMKMAAPRIKEYQKQPGSPSIQRTIPNGSYQAPRNRSTAIAPAMNITVYSAKKNIAHLMPLYSVRKPATSSDSLSGRSKGARLQLASVEMKKRTKGKMIPFPKINSHVVSAKNRLTRAMVMT